MKRDFPSWRRFLYLPNLLWFNCSDWFMVWLLRAGCAVSLYGAVFGPQLWMFVVALLVQISFQMLSFANWPWDYFLSGLTTHHTSQHLLPSHLRLVLPSIGQQSPRSSASFCRCHPLYLRRVWCAGPFDGSPSV